MKPHCFRFRDRLVRIDLSAQPIGISDQVVTAAPFLLEDGQLHAIESDGQPLQLPASTERGALNRALDALALIGYTDPEPCDCPE